MQQTVSTAESWIKYCCSCRNKCFVFLRGHDLFSTYRYRYRYSLVSRHACSPNTETTNMRVAWGPCQLCGLGGGGRFLMSSLSANKPGRFSPVLVGKEVGLPPPHHPAALRSPVQQLIQTPRPARHPPLLLWTNCSADCQRSSRLKVGVTSSFAASVSLSSFVW